jgi:ATP-dependent Clp protease ATP-binding subunit ClpC
MNNRLILYSYTADRLKEFKESKKENDIITTAIAIADAENKPIFNDDDNIYLDISNYYKSLQDNPIAIERIIIEVIKRKNCHLIINFNLLTRFKSDFGEYIDNIFTIQSIYGSNSDENISFNNLNKINVSKLKENLDNYLYGHKEFKDEFIKKIKNYNILYNLEELKIMSVLICGNSGIGKTELAKIIHNTFYTNSKMIKINLGNYKTQGALNSLIGSPKGYYGSERGGELSNKIQNSDSKVILIDEFEKADVDIFNFFYELLEDGKFTDLNENEFDLTGYLIIFTSNLNENNYKDIIPAPLLSRFTMKTIFEPLDFATKSKYVKERCQRIVEIYNKKYSCSIDYSVVLEKINKKTIQSINNLRYLNQVVQNALISFIDN